MAPVLLGAAQARVTPNPRGLLDAARRADDVAVGVIGFQHDHAHETAIGEPGSLAGLAQDASVARAGVALWTRSAFWALQPERNRIELELVWAARSPKSNGRTVSQCPIGFLWSAHHERVRDVRGKNERSNEKGEGKFPHDAPPTATPCPARASSVKAHSLPRAAHDDDHGQRLHMITSIPSLLRLRLLSLGPHLLLTEVQLIDDVVLYQRIDGRDDIPTTAAPSAPRPPSGRSCDSFSTWPVSGCGGARQEHAPTARQSGFVTVLGVEGTLSTRGTIRLRRVPRP